MSRGTRKHNGKYIFIPPDTEAEAEMRRSQTVKELGAVKAELGTLETLRADLQEEVKCLNRWIRREPR